MKKINFGSSDMDVILDVERKEDDQLALSSDAVTKMVNGLMEAFKASIFKAMEEGLTPRGIRFVGKFTIHGIKQ